MALTRVTKTVISDDAIDADKLADDSIITRHIADGAITVAKLDGTASVTALETRINANLNILDANADAIESRRVSNAAEIAAVEARRVANIGGAISTVVATNLTASRALISGSGGKIEVSDVTSAEIAHLDGVTSAIQTQLNTLTSNAEAQNTELDAAEARRTANIAGAVSTITTADLTADRAVISTGSGKVGVSAVTATEIGHLDGVTSAIQTQFNDLTSNIGGLIDGMTFTGQVNMSDDLVVTGNLTVNGTTTTVDTNELTVKDRMILLASGASGSPSLDVGLLFNRGNQGNAAFFYDESARTFKLSDTKDPLSNTALSPITSSNLDVGIVTSASLVSTAITQNGATLNDLISSNVDGAISTVHDTDLTASRALVSDGSGKIVVSDVTSTELGHLDGVTSAIQTQFTGAETRRTNNIAGAISSVLTSDLTASRAVVSGSGGKIEVSAVTSTEIGHLDGVTSAIQTQINDLESRRNANVGVANANDFVTFTRLNANLNVVQDNVAALSGGGIVLSPHHNVNTSTSTSNVFFIGKNITALNNVISVMIDGVQQVRDVPGTSNNDFIFHNANNTIQLTEASIPAGLTVQTLTLFS